ncbi:MAG: SDR family oxidoreductase [Candidatus Hodarchaeota archaeon]
MDLGLEGKVAIVAASSKGIGKAIALALAREGTKLAICARGEEALRATADEIIGKTGVEVLAIKADVTVEEDVQELVRSAAKKFGRIDILVSNSGGPPTGVFEDIPQETWEKAVDLNLMSTIYLCRAVIPYMKKQKWGRIINMTSVSVKQPINGLILSNAVRAGVVGLSKSLSNETAKDNILINVVGPGYTLTERVRELARSKAAKEGISEEEVYEAWEGRIPLGRLAQSEEIANLVVFLASEKASYITGTTIQVDGGLVKSLL